MPDVRITGPAGRLEARYHPDPVAGGRIALVLHPHPEHGGTMNNKVVFALDRAFRRHGFATLRFNFRGVGHSEGGFGQGEGELADAAAALDWLCAHHPDATCRRVAGYSFGAWIALRLLVQRPDLDGFVAVAPPVGLLDFGFLDPCPAALAAGLIVQGDQDDLVSEPAVSRFAQTLAGRPGLPTAYQPIAGADHFFTRHLDQLSHHLESYLRQR